MPDDDRSEPRLHALEVDVFRHPGYGHGTPAESARLSVLSDKLRYLESLEHTQGPASARFKERLNAMIKEVRRLQGRQRE